MTDRPCGGGDFRDPAEQFFTDNAREADVEGIR